MLKKLICFVGYLCGLSVADAADWGYQENENTVGPNSWKKSYPICGESYQSPIAIFSDQSKVNASLGEFARSIFDVLPSKMVLENTGHSLQVNIENGYVINNPALLPAQFKIGQFHLHWAKPNETGSEHTLNGKQYFGELHLVHYNTKYDGIGNAANRSDGLAVLGFFIESDYPQDNLAFQRILNLVENGSVKMPQDAYTYAQVFTVETILPSDYNVYFRYRGSLTTPPCYESVVWTVFETPIRISRAQAYILQNFLFSKNGEKIQGNFRPTLPLNGREVEKSPACVRGAASSLSGTFQEFLLVSLVSTFWLIR